MTLQAQQDLHLSLRSEGSSHVASVMATGLHGSPEAKLRHVVQLAGPRDSSWGTLHEQTPNVSQPFSVITDRPCMARTSCYAAGSLVVVVVVMVFELLVFLLLSLSGKACHWRCTDAELEACICVCCFVSAGYADQGWVC